MEANTDRILAQFDRAGVRATFFTLGWVAVRYPALVRRIVAGGHELASHGWEHVLGHDQTEAEFGADIGRTRKLLEDVSGTAVTGYRAATFSISSAGATLSACMAVRSRPRPSSWIATSRVSTQG